MRLWQASAAFYVAVFAFCELLRWLVERFAFVGCKNGEEGEKQRHVRSWAKTLALEFIGVLQLCVPVFDVNFVIENYGLTGVFWEIAFIELMNGVLLREALADPCALFFDFYRNGSTENNALQRLSALLGVQFLAGYCSFFVARQFYSLGLHPQHSAFGRGECSADLTVGILFGSAVEALGVVAATLSTHYFEHRSKLDRKVVALACASASGLITVLGIHLTGMYANPIVAWALTFNCGEVTPLAHFAVYWAGPFLAHILANDVLLKRIQQLPPAASQSVVDENGDAKVVETKPEPIAEEEEERTLVDNGEDGDDQKKKTK